MAGLQSSSSGTLAAEENDEMHKEMTLADYTLIFGSSSEVRKCGRGMPFVYRCCVVSVSTLHCTIRNNGLATSETVVVVVVPTNAQDGVGLIVFAL